MLHPLLRRFRHVCALVLLGGAALAHAATISDQQFDDRIRLADTELVLNGLGLRQVAWFKGYAAGLYLAAKATTPAAVLAARGPKRLRMKMMVEVESKEFVKATDVGMQRNHTPEEHAALEARIAKFDATVTALRVLRKGDVVDLDFLPGQGMLLTVNGTRQGDVLPGDDFYAGLLKIFIGAKPVDARLKAGLLGGG